MLYYFGYVCLPVLFVVPEFRYHIAAASVVLIDLQQCCSHSLVYIYIHIQDMGSWAFDISVVTYTAQQPHILDVRRHVPHVLDVPNNSLVNRNHLKKNEPNLSYALSEFCIYSLQTHAAQIFLLSCSKNM